MKTKDSNRWALLIIAFIVACLVWYMVVSRENPKVNISVGNVAVTVQGSGNLHEKGYAYFIEDYDTIGVEVDVAQKKAVLVDAEDFRLLADVSECTEGENTITVDSQVINNRSIIGNNYSLKHDSITVRVEKMVSKDIPVELNVTGTVADGFSRGDIITSKNVITALVPESLENVDYKAMIDVDVSSAKKTVEYETKVTIADSMGNPVDTESLQICPEDNVVSLIVPVGKKVTLPLELPDETSYVSSEYYCKNISSETDEVSVLGPEKTVQGLTEIRITASDLNLSKATKSFSKEISLSSYLPEDVYVQDAEERTVTVDVDIEELSEKLFTISTDNVTVSGGKKSNVKFGSEQVKLTVCGSHDVLKSLTSDDIQMSVDITDLEKGTYYLTPTISFPDTDQDEYIEIQSVSKIEITVNGS